MLRIIAATLALAFLLSTQSASAAPRYLAHRHDVDGYSRIAQMTMDRDGRYVPAIERSRAPVSRSPYRARGRVHRVAYVPEPATQAIAGARAGGQASARFATIAVEHSRPADCYGIQWCGCWLRHTLGLADRSLNLAIAWARVGSPASPHEANVVVWRHHVGQLLAYENGRILIRSGNDRGAVRTRWVSPGILGGVVAYRRV